MKKNILRKNEILQLFFIYITFLSFNLLIFLSKHSSIKEGEKVLSDSIFLPLYDFKEFVFVFTVTPFIMWNYYIIDKTSIERKIRIVLGDTKFNIFVRIFIKILEVSLLSSIIVFIFLNIFFQYQNLSIIIWNIIKLNSLFISIEALIFFVFYLNERKGIKT